MNAPLRTNVTHEGQTYVDIPQYEVVSKAKPLVLAVNCAFEGGPAIAPSIQDISHYERTPLRWMVPDGKGGLKPKYADR